MQLSDIRSAAIFLCSLVSVDAKLWPQLSRCWGSSSERWRRARCERRLWSGRETWIQNSIFRLSAPTSHKLNKTTRQGASENKFIMRHEKGSNIYLNSVSIVSRNDKIFCVLSIRRQDIHFLIPINKCSQPARHD